MLQSPLSRAQFDAISFGAIPRRRRASTVDFLRLTLPLPPLVEQRRIAAILDKADAVRARGTEARSRRSELRTRVIEESFARATRVATLGTFIAESQNGLYKPRSSYGQGTPIVRIDAFDGVTPGFVSDLKRVTLDDEERTRFAVRPGDVLINRVNAPSHLGKSMLIPDLTEPTVFESNMMRLSLRADVVSPAVVSSWLSTADAKSQIRTRAKKAVNQASVNQRDIASLTIPVLADEQQSTLVACLAAIDESGRADKRRTSHLDALFASLQHRAFRGEL